MKTANNTDIPRLAGRVATLEPELIAFRRDIHSHPELSFQEHRTTKRILDTLEAAGLDPVPLEGTGAYVDIGSGKIQLGLRADIDALPVLEETGLAYASIREGVAHACGHDIHTINRAGKRKRTRLGWGSRNKTKRAIVTLKEGTIDIFGGPLS